MQPFERGQDGLLPLAVIPEEKLPLRLFFLLRPCRIDPFKCVRVIACIVYLRGQSHGSGGEILYLLDVEVQFLGLYGKIGDS